MKKRQGKIASRKTSKRQVVDRSLEPIVGRPGLVREKLAHLAMLYASMRGIGHTHAMLNGAVNSQCAIIVHSLAFANSLRKDAPHNKIYVLRDGSELAGLHMPIAWDNGALALLFEQAVADIRWLENECCRLQRLCPSNHKLTHDAAK